MMDGRTRFMGVRKTKKKGGWTRIRNGIQRRKKGHCLVESNAVFGGKSELEG